MQLERQDREYLHGDRVTKQQHLERVIEKHPLLEDPKAGVGALAGFWLSLIARAYDQGKADERNTKHFLPLPHERANERDD